MSFTSLLPSQIGKEWSRLPASYVWFYPDTIVVEWQFDAVGNPVQPHILVMSTECCGSGPDGALFMYLQLYRKVRGRWEVVPFTTVTAVLGGDSIPSDISFFEHYPNRIQDCIGYQSPNCGPDIPVNTRLDFVSFNNQISAWIASAEEVFGLPSDNVIYDPDFEGCSLDFCEGKDPGWYVTFQIGDGSALGITLDLLGVEFDPSVTLKVSDPIFDSNGFETSTITEWLLEQALQIIASWITEKGVSAIAVRTANPFAIALTFAASAIIDSLEYDLEFCPGGNQDPPPPGDDGCVNCVEDPPILMDPYSPPLPNPNSPPLWDDYRFCYTVKRTLTTPEGSARGGPCPPPCPLWYSIPYGKVVTVSYISNSFIVRVPKGSKPPNLSPTITTSLINTANGISKTVTGYWNAPAPDSNGNWVLPDVAINSSGGATYSPQFANHVFATGGVLLFDFACNAPWFGCEPFLRSTKTDIEYKVTSQYYSRDHSSCVIGEPKSCTATILLRRIAVGFNPISSFMELFGADAGDLVTIQLPVDNCPINPVLYASGLSPGASGTWFLDVGVPTTGVVEINTGQGTSSPSGAPAGIIPLPSSVKIPQPGIPGQLVDVAVTWALIDTICTCE